MNNGSYQLPVGDTIKTAWNKVHGSKAPIWVALIILIAISIGASILDSILAKSMPTVAPAVSIIMQIFTYIISIGLIYMGIQRARDLPISYDQLFRGFRDNLWLKAIGLYILQTLIMIIPILLIVTGVVFFGVLNANNPNAGSGSFIAGVVLVGIGLLAMIYLAIRLMLSIGFMMDREYGPLDAIKFSFRASRGNFWNIFFFSIIQSLIVVISAIPLLIGLIWTVPFSIIGYGLMYDRLSSFNMGVASSNPKV